MAMATARYCGRCGAPLAPGAGFCGRCGTPVVMQAAAAQPVYRYAPAPPVAFPPRGPGKLPPALVAGGLVLILLAVAVVVGAIAIAQFGGGKLAPCTQNCAPKIVTPLPEEASWRSSAYGFQVNYSSSWTVRDQDASSVTLGTRVGSVQVSGARGGTPDRAIQATVSALPSAKWQDVTLVGALKGAHIGEQDGVGAVYSANLIGASQTATKVRFAVIAATKAGVTVVIFAVDPADPKNAPNGMPEGQAFDYLGTEFSWS
jgi:zinc ribbon protein